MKDDTKTIKITCTGAAVLGIEKLSLFQGNLKELSKENYEKLKQEIIKHGFSFPVFVWKNDGKNHVLDGHQRINVLLAMQKEGYTIPKLPVDWIQAKDKREAKEKILAAVSQYGKITEEGLYEFTNTAGIKFEDFKAFTDLPGINFDRYEAGYVNQPEPREVDESIADGVEMCKCPKCGHEFPK